jgi:hypothetical protein
MKRQDYFDRFDFLRALEGLDWFLAVRDNTRGMDAQQWLRFCDGYPITDRWLLDVITNSARFWRDHPDSEHTKLGHFASVDPVFEPPADAGDHEAALEEFFDQWRVIHRPLPLPEIPDPALWTALKFGGKPVPAIAKENCSQKSKDPEALVAKTIARFAKRISLAMPDHSHCEGNPFLAPYRAARIGST